jgi:hypothetical protein
LSHKGEPLDTFIYQEVSASPRINQSKQKKHEEPLRLEPFSVVELKRFFAILLYSAEEKINRVGKLWNRNPKYPCHLRVASLMSQNRFQLMYSCFIFDDPSMKRFENIIGKKVREIWIPANFSCCDESLVPYKGRKSNPHHVFIMRKPHPHGVKVCFFLSLFSLSSLY